MSGRQGSNLRPLDPQPNVLAIWTTPRMYQYMHDTFLDKLPKTRFIEKLSLNCICFTKIFFAINKFKWSSRTWPRALSIIMFIYSCFRIFICSSNIYLKCLLTFHKVYVMTHKSIITQYFCQSPSVSQWLVRLWRKLRPDHTKYCILF